VTLSSQRPRWRVSASDLSPDALAVARTNAVRHEAADRMTFVQGDLLAPFMPRREHSLGSSAAPHVGLRIDVLVSNPPYIPAADLTGLQREVRDYEPHLALDGGADGLVPYRRMLEQLPLLQQVPRIVAFELGLGQPRIVADMMRSIGAWDDIRIICDYAGIERHIIATQSQPR
jgi:release factor glutamine methyltransferase